MKKILLTLLLAFVLLSCSQKLISNSNGDNSPIGIINKEIKSGNVNHKTSIYLEKDKISLEELELLNTFESKDFTSIEVLNKTQAKEAIGANEKVIQLIPFRDELLNSKFYSDISNELVIETIKTLNETGQVKLNPLLVLNGIPLRGNEISTEINSINKDNIKSISLLKKQAAYSIYGIRAINGVILISTK